MRRQQEHVAFAQVDPLVAVAVPQQQMGVALELVEKLLQRVVVEVAALVRSADDGDDQVAVGEHLAVADRRLQQLGVVGQPALEVERGAVSERGHCELPGW